MVLANLHREKLPADEACSGKPPRSPDDCEEFQVLWRNKQPQAWAGLLGPARHLLAARLLLPSRHRLLLLALQIVPALPGRSTGHPIGGNDRSQTPTPLQASLRPRQTHAS